MEKLKKIGDVIEKIAKIIVYVSFAAVAVLVLLNVADVFVSKITGAAISGAYEISECTLMCAVFAAFAYGQVAKTHVHMTLFISKFHGRLKYIPFFIGNLISTALVIVVTYATAVQAGREFADYTVTGILHIPYYPFYYLAVVCMAVFALTLIYDLILSFLAMFKDEYGEMVSCHW